MSITVLKRRSKDKYLFYSSDRRYKSEYYNSEEDRDNAAIEYLNKIKEQEKERDAYLKKLRSNE